MYNTNTYYPYGSQISSLSSGAPIVPNDYKYNGKEYVDNLGLNMLDYGARLYDPLTARWNGVDPLASEFPGWSPYNYTLDNPIRLIDPDGRKPITPETVWDVINVGMGVASFGANIATGNWLGAIADVSGLAYDAFATMVPVLPAGGSTAIGVYRLSKLTGKVKGSISAAKNVVAGKGKAFEDISIRLGKLETSITKHGKLDDLIGAVKEKLGIALENPKPGGSPTRHIQEIKGVINSINRTNEQLKGILKNGDLSKDEINILKQTQSRIMELGDKYNSILNAADKAAEKLN